MTRTITANHLSRRHTWASATGKVLLSTAVTLLGVVTISVATAPPAFASTGLYVSNSGSDTGNNCQTQSSPCLTIGHALTEASGPTTINVAAGTYPEQLTINESDVTIVGAGAGTVIEPTTLSESDTDTDSNTPQAVIVYIEPDTTNVDIEDLTVDGADGNGFANPGITDYVGIYYRDATGAITNVTVTDIEQVPADFGDQPGANGGIYVATDSTTTQDSDVTMTDVTVNNYDKNGITCDDVGTVCTITGSTITGLGPIPTNSDPDQVNAQNGVQIWGASADIDDNTVSDNSYTDPTYPGGQYYAASGLLLINPGTLTVDQNTLTGNDEDIYALEDASDGHVASPGVWTISDNDASHASNNSGTVSGSTKVPFGDGIGDGIDVDSTTNSVFVSDNQMDDDVEYGSALYGTNGVTVQDNTADTDGDGIYVGGPGAVGNLSEDNVITENTTVDNAMIGISADTNSYETDNTFTGNDSGDNAQWDCLDLSTGAATDGTANTWSSDAGTSSSPAGICSPTPEGLYVSDVDPFVGPTTDDTPVTITGAGFTGATVVDFGDVAGTGLNVTSATSLTVTPPPESAGTVDVTVTTPAGTSARSQADRFTYNAPQSSTVACDPACTNVVDTPLNSTSVTVTGSSTASASTTLELDTGTLSCPGPYDYATDLSTLSTTGFAADSLVTVTESVAGLASTLGVKVCFAEDGATTGTFLSKCKKADKNAPCLQALVEESSGAGVSATLVVPANDPRFWTGGAAVDLKSFSPTEGAPGSAVTIKGKNLALAQTVVIGGAQAVIDTAESTATKLVVTVPSNALTGLISVTAASGVAVSTKEFKVT